MLKYYPGEQTSSRMSLSSSGLLHPPKIIRSLLTRGWVVLFFTQFSSLTHQCQKTSGSNAYAVMSSPRTSGTEAMVISASWLSLVDEGEGTINIRGVSTVLALANFLRSMYFSVDCPKFRRIYTNCLDYSLWAKDIIFVISDGYLDGMHAWLSAYHGTSQSSRIFSRCSFCGRA